MVSVFYIQSFWVLREIFATCKIRELSFPFSTWSNISEKKPSEVSLGSFDLTVKVMSGKGQDGEAFSRSKPPE